MPQKWLSVRQSDYERCMTKSGDSPWVRVHRSLLRDLDFVSMPPAARFLYIGLLFLSTETGNRIYNDSTYLGQMLYIHHTEIDLKPLYRSGLLVTSNVSRELGEKRREEGEKKEIREETAAPSGFEVFWKLYPRKKSKGDAKRAWAKLKPNEQLHDRILRALERAKTSDDWTKDAGKYIPYPASWLNAEGWEDEPTKVVPIRLQQPVRTTIVEDLPKGEPCPPEAAAVLDRLMGKMGSM